MQTTQAALDFIQQNNQDGTYNSILADHDAGKIDIGLLSFDDQRGLELLRDNNILGRFDELITLAEYLRAPVVYIVPVV